jgi:hypothetical protein
MFCIIGDFWSFVVIIESLLHLLAAKCCYYKADVGFKHLQEQ